MLLLDEDYSELLDAAGEAVWCSDDDDNFDYDHDTTESDVVNHLLKTDVISEEGEISETVDERAEADDDDSEDDDDDDDDDSDDD